MSLVSDESELASVLHTTVQGAGRLIMDRRHSHDAVLTKGKGEIVTRADLASNDYIVAALAKAYPGIPVFTEESSTLRSQSPTRWIVDPLDGTTPWVWGNSGFAVSIALEQDGELQAGIVYDPVMEETFYAERGAGASRNGSAITPRAPDRIADALVVVDWGNRDDKREEGLAYLKRFLLPDMFASRVVPQFAPALGLCRIAEGRIHGLVCNDTWVEDHAAGALILREAGGWCTNFYDTDGFDARSSGIIAASDLPTHKKLVQRLRG